jgi:hypothetical protein
MWNSRAIIYTSIYLKIFELKSLLAKIMKVRQKWAEYSDFTSKTILKTSFKKKIFLINLLFIN